MKLLRLSVQSSSLLALILACLASPAAQAETGGRLLATGGAVSLESTAGGGITPWAVLAGYGSDSQVGCAAAITAVETRDYGLRSIGGACSWGNRVELSIGRQALDLDGLRPLLGLPDGQMLRQRFIGMKVRLAGDIVYHPLGQLSAGVIYKDTRDRALARVAGAARTADTDWYLSAGKLLLDGPFDRMTYLNVTARATRANQGGLLGFGGNREGSRTVNIELAAATFLRRDLAVGVEYRQKPDNLGFAAEDDWQDLFVAWFPSKHVSVVGAWAFLGSIGTLPDQDGPYLSIAGSF